ncbi:sugar MFS transporter [Pseudoflavonifractor sp. MSJ-37]|uniref:MFS transporter n=1 Tax=Pseudoflavonifractor sp. MSJ-37 TaxID=2841531 RepID=UPI001C118349|nr:MFS transporter [Pseudoflavonifractor sp. MSJ-37]MBU5434075.1 MFS transporter [Pseudoflavonifractor sp. MSJ-37]
MKNYKKTLRACYLGFITQAIAANFAPLLFWVFHSDFNISLGQIALIPAVFYVTQLGVDLICAKYVDSIGYRKSIVTSQLFAGLGLIELAVLPDLMSPYIGILIGVFFYAVGSGLVEVLCSPIVEACPFEHKEKVMSLLHSFYCWGSVSVILLSTLFFAIFGIDSWRILAYLWSMIPLYNIYNFATCPIERLVEGGQGMSFRQLLKTPIFKVAIILMICAGASEMSMAQWASAFAESALGLTKSVGDLAGPCLFAITMGIARVLYGKFGEKIDLTKFMLVSGVLCVLSYLLAGLSTMPVLGLIGCIICGFSVGIMWPGSISIAAPRIPKGGTALFALLAVAGDMGGALGPSMVGYFSQQAGDDLQAGLLIGCIFPLIMLVALIAMRKMARRDRY